MFSSGHLHISLPPPLHKKWKNGGGPTQPAHALHVSFKTISIRPGPSYGTSKLRLRSFYTRIRLPVSTSKRTNLFVPSATVCYGMVPKKCPAIMTFTPCAFTAGCNIRRPVQCVVPNYCRSEWLETSEKQLVSE